MIRDKDKWVVMLGTSPQGRGGIATVVRNYFASGLMEHCRVRYITTHVQGSRLAKLFAAAHALCPTLGVLIAREAAVFHLHMSSGPSTWRKCVFMGLARVFRVPYVIHMHGGDYLEFFRAECGPARRRLVRTILHGAERILVLSRSWEAAIHAIAPQARTMIVYNAVALPATENLRPQADVRDDDRLILFLGRVEEKKGAFDLIEAAARLTGRFRLVICGEGAIDRATQHARIHGIESRVCFPGWIEGPAKRDLLQRASIFVLPSYHEGVPMAVLEAMSWSIPVVATAVGGIPEIVTDGGEGLLVQPGDPIGLAGAINRLLDDAALRSALGGAGRRRIQLRFSEPVLNKQLADLWDCFRTARAGETCREQI